MLLRNIHHVEKSLTVIFIIMISYIPIFTYAQDELTVEIIVQNTAVFGIFQETLTNIARHAEATKAGVQLQVKNGEI